MVKFFVKQFLYGRVYLWLKPKIYGLLFLLLAISSIFYLHNEYLRYLEINDDNYLIGLSFVIKNILIICLVIGYLIFQYFLNKSNDKIEKLERGCRYCIRIKSIICIIMMMCWSSATWKMCLNSFMVKADVG